MGIAAVAAVAALVLVLWGVSFFQKEPVVGKRIEVLNDLGLGYLTLGPSSTTLRLDAGSHTLQARAVDRTGDVQSEASVEPAPDGAEGLHTVTFTVT